MALKKEKAMGSERSPMASIPASGMDLWVTLAKIEIKEAKVEHLVSFKVCDERNKTYKVRSVKENLTFESALGLPGLQHELLRMPSL